MDGNVFEKNLKIFSPANATSFQAHGSQVVLVAFFIFVEVGDAKMSVARRAIGTDAPDNIITNKGDTRRYKNKWPWRARQPDAPHAETARETCL